MNANVLIITVDALRADRIGAFNGRELTPNIDKLATESTIFTNAFSTTNATDPAVTSIQTGRYPLSHGIVNHGRQVTDREKETVEKVAQLSEILSKYGYQTAKFGRPLGRWHRNGFDRYPSSMESRVAFDEQDEADSEYPRFGDLLQRVHPKIYSAGELVYQTTQDLLSEEQAPIKKEDVLTKYQEQEDEVIQDFENFIQDSEPFYAFVHLMDTHTPYEANPDTVQSYLEQLEYQPKIPMEGTGRHPKTFDRLVEQGAYPDIKEKYYLSDGTPTTAITDAHYDASATQADKRVGEILRILKERGLYDKTLVVFLSDHGESLTEHGIYHDHHGLYDVTIRVPLIIRPPNGSNGEITELVQTTDIAPTVEAYTDSDGIDADGYSLRPVIEQHESVDREYILAEEAHTQRRRMVRSKELKLIYLIDGNTVCRYCNVQHAPDIELYNLTQDPSEVDNIADAQEDAVLTQRGYGETAAEEFTQKRPAITGEGDLTYEDEDEIKERLDALGYR